MPHITATDLFSLSIPERIQRVKDIWNSIATQPEMVELTPEAKNKLKIRLKEYEQHPQDQASWNKMRSRLWHLA